ncbi:MAG: hypothetical protein ACP5GX_00115 [Anaerolineae bacterium]
MGAVAAAVGAAASDRQPLEEIPIIVLTALAIPDDGGLCLAADVDARSPPSRWTVGQRPW